MIVDEVIARLEAVEDSPFRIVAGAADMPALTDQPTAWPAVYVFIKEEASDENSRLTGVLQRTEVDLAVVIVAGNLADARGHAAAADIEALKAAVRGTLVGWQPASAEDVITHVGGQLVRNRGGLLWWEMTLGVAFYIAQGE